jgi:hypothetical protein
MQPHLIFLSRVSAPFARPLAHYFNQAVANQRLMNPRKEEETAKLNKEALFENPTKQILQKNENS